MRQQFVLRAQNPRVHSASPGGEPDPMTIHFSLNPQGILAVADGPPGKLKILRQESGGFITVQWGDHVVSGVITRDHDHSELLHIGVNGYVQAARLSEAALDAMAQGISALQQSSGLMDITSPIPGLVKFVVAELHGGVEAGQTICILEAMKMENDIVAPHKGTLAALEVKAGQTVAAGEILARIKI